MKSFLGWYSKWYDKIPYTAAFITCYIKGTLADGITQTSTNGNIDMARNIRFSIWSGGYCGCIQHYIYNILYQRIFPIHSIRNTIFKTLIDNGFTMPFFSLPQYCVFKSWLLGDKNWFQQGITNYRNELWGVMKYYWRVWLIGTFIALSLPIQFRILTIGCISLGWLMILSAISPMSDHENKTNDISIHDIKNQKLNDL